MPASLQFGVGPSFRGGLTPRPVSWRALPSEGDRSISANIAWGVDDINPSGAPTGVLNVDCSHIATQEFSQIAALYVDNLTSGADVDFIFQDTQFRLTVPAGSQGLYPVISTTRNFTVLSPQALAGDATFLQILNSLPPPVAIEKSVFMSTATVQAVPITADSMTIILGINVIGTMTALQVSIAGAQGGAAAGTVQIELVDGDGAILGIATIGFLNATTFIPFAVILDLDSINVRFEGPVNMIITHTGTLPASGTADVQFLYRTP